MTKEFIPAVFALTLALPAAALANEFSAMDADGDGYVTMTEFQEAIPDAEADTFTAADADADGALSEEEVAAAVDAGLITKTEG